MSSAETDHILEKASTLLAQFKGDYAEIRFSKRLSSGISLSKDRTDSITSGESLGGSIRILDNGTWSFLSFNDPEKMDQHMARVLELARAKRPSGNKTILRNTPLKKFFKTNKGIHIDQISIEEKLELMKYYNDILKSNKKIQNTRTLYRDIQSSSIFANSDGTAISDERSMCGASFSSVARDGQLIEPYHESVSGYGGFEIVNNLESLAEKTVRTAVDMLSARQIRGGTFPVIIDQKLAGVFIHEAFGHLSEADFIHENEPMKQTMIIGTRFGPDELSVIDDGSLSELPGYIPCDDEGVLPSKTMLIKNGLLSGRLHSRETAAAMDEELTGNARAISATSEPIVRMTNTYIENGNHDPEELFRHVGKGIYACDVIGGQTNLEMFTFTAAYGFEIKNGKIGPMIRDIVLSGNLFKTLKNIALIGNDRKMFGGLGGCGKGGQSPLSVSFGGPHLLINDVLIGGHH